MDVLNEMILLMGRKEVKNFKIYASRVTDTNDRKDLRLFEMVRVAGSDFNEEKTFQKLYPSETDKNGNAGQIDHRRPVETEQLRPV
jgi:hypothetical protein